MGVEASRKVIDKAIDSGINFFDTSDSYGTSEDIPARSWASGVRRSFWRPSSARSEMPSAKSSGASRGYILAEAEESLRRLRNHYIDLYQIHYPDPNTPIEETLRALDDLVKSGKVRYIGCSILCRPVCRRPRAPQQSTA